MWKFRFYFTENSHALRLGAKSVVVLTQRCSKIDDDERVGHCCFDGLSLDNIFVY